MSVRLTEPVEIVLDLPFPPSMNRIWRAGGRKSTGGRTVYRSDEYLDWMREADNLVMARRAFPKRKIHGAFSAEVTLSRKVRGDVDNRIKALLDFLQSREIIKNDSNCKRLTVERGEAECGCQVVLHPWQQP
jgi:Holliday junction resolvase RusA-like endonuclease